jgi:hypothetical protein
MGHLTADLTADEAIAAHERIDLLARRVKTPERTLGQCRADVFRDLILGKGGEHVQVRVNVTVPMTTLLSVCVGRDVHVLNHSGGEGGEDGDS